MSLADHWDGGYLQAGWHHVKVVDHRCFDAKSGNSGVEFQFQSVSDGAKGKEGFMLLDKCLWRLAGFARACGFTREEAANYDPFNSNHHRKLHGLECLVEMVKKGEYHEVEGFRSIKDGEPPAPKIDRSSETPTAKEAHSASDDIPF